MKITKVKMKILLKTKKKKMKEMNILIKKIMRQNKIRKKITKLINQMIKKIIITKKKIMIIMK
jgi:hypothetical protein